jgi:hypothetical protein
MAFKSAKDVLEDENFNPTIELVKLAKNLTQDYESIRESNEAFTNSNPEAKLMVSLEMNKLAKTNVEVIKTISDIKQKEDDLRLRLTEMENRAEERKEARKQLRPGEGQQHYYIPAYSRELQADGKYKMVKIDAS